MPRRALGIAAAIALVGIYLSVAAVAHLNPWRNTAATASSTLPATGGSGAASGQGTSPDASPDPAPDTAASPTSPYATLRTMIPSNVQSGTCKNVNTSLGAIAQVECDRVSNLGAGAIIYYLYASTQALSSGFSNFLKTNSFHQGPDSCTANNTFSEFIPSCKANYKNTSPSITGSVAEYLNTNNNPIIVSTDNQQLAMAVLVGTNENSLLAYWKQMQWVVTGG